MATERLSMRNTREILRLKYSLGLSHRQVARSLGLSIGSVGETLRRARRSGLDWAQAEGLPDEPSPEPFAVRTEEAPIPVS